MPNPVIPIIRQNIKNRVTIVGGEVARKIDNGKTAVSIPQRG
jgi:hypothetical protein